MSGEWAERGAASDIQLLRVRRVYIAPSPSHKTAQQGSSRTDSDGVAKQCSRHQALRSKHTKSVESFQLIRAHSHKAVEQTGFDIPCFGHDELTGRVP